MKVGLIGIEPKIFNTAYMQIAYHYKQQGDTVEWAAPLEYDKYDKLYCSSLFDFTDKSQVPDRAICGGTGFDLTTKLPFDCDYDYSIYPKCDFSIVWFSRGCIRKCPFCAVHEKEGGIKPVQSKNLNPEGKYIVVSDNNFFASPNWKHAIWRLTAYGQRVSFNGGIDVRILKPEHCVSLNNLKLHKQIYIAWDNPKTDLISQLEMLVSYIKPSRIACYVLIGYWSTPEENLHRVETLRSFKIDLFAMPYNKKDFYQKRFARWVNHKAIFKTVKWEDCL